MVKRGTRDKNEAPSQPLQRWKHQRWGTLEDPVHKSHMSTLLGEYSCTRQFHFDRERELHGEDERETCSGKTEVGTAAHETIARALRNDELRESILAGAPRASIEQVRRVLEVEFQRATAGRTVRWYGKAEADDTLADAAAMVHGLFSDLHRHVAAVELVEAGFIAQLGPYWIEGHTDLIYRPRENPEALAFTDWKTGAQKPHQLALDHGYESGFYSVALERGLFLPVALVEQWRELARADRSAEVPLDAWDMTALRHTDDDRRAMHLCLRAVARRQSQGLGLAEGARQFHRFPEVIRLTHLADYVPYEKKGAKKVERPEDVAHWSRVFGREVTPGEKITYERGQTRGGAWLHVRRTPGDVQRLERLLRAVVGWVRMGKFVESVGEKCTRCPYKAACLTSGYELAGDEAKALNASLRGLDHSGTDELSLDDD